MTQQTDPHDKPMTIAIQCLLVIGGILLFLANQLPLAELLLGICVGMSLGRHIL